MGIFKIKCTITLFVLKQNISEKIKKKCMLIIVSTKYYILFDNMFRITVIKQTLIGC